METLPNPQKVQICAMSRAKRSKFPSVPVRSPDGRVNSACAAMSCSMEALQCRARIAASRKQAQVARQLHRMAEHQDRQNRNRGLLKAALQKLSSITRGLFRENGMFTKEAAAASSSASSTTSSTDARTSSSVAYDMTSSYNGSAKTIEDDTSQKDVKYAKRQRKVSDPIPVPKSKNRQTRRQEKQSPETSWRHKRMAQRGTRAMGPVLTDSFLHPLGAQRVNPTDYFPTSSPSPSAVAFVPDQLPPLPGSVAKTTSTSLTDESDKSSQAKRSLTRNNSFSHVNSL